jgi:Lon protease-like protein
MSLCLATETLPFEAGDPEWVADLFDTMQAGDLDAVVNQLDELVRVMRKAAKARRMLASVEPDLLRAGLAARAQRGSS